MSSQWSSRTPSTNDPLLDQPALNRSLERGLKILRCFRPGVGALGNADLVERTGLPKATVSRLTQTLIRNGFLRKEAETNLFHLSFSVLSLAHTVMLDSQVTHEALPLMQALGDEHHINVGLSVPDDLDMVYLHVVHGDRSRVTRRIEPGHRRPIETNAVGRAYLGILEPTRRAELLARCRRRHRTNWTQIASDVEAAFAQVEAQGYCSLVWEHGTQSIAMPMLLDEGIFVVNISFSVDEYSPEQADARLLPALMRLGRDLRPRLVTLQPEAPNSVA